MSRVCGHDRLVPKEDPRKVSESSDKQRGGKGVAEWPKVDQTVGCMVER